MEEQIKHEHFELTREFLDNFITLIEKRDDAPMQAVLEPLHPADIAEIYEELNIDQAIYTFLLLDKEVAADVLVELDEDDRAKLLNHIPSNVLADRFMEHMDSDDAADLLQEMSDEQQEAVLQHIKDKEQAEDIKE
ncbi:MAG: magnesium transporter, partial [Bacteroidia bacterium]